MRSEAYRLTGFTAVISALGFMLRWLQNMNIIDPETGLAVHGTVISGLMVVLIVIVAVVIAGFAFYLRRYDAPLLPEEALGGHTFLFTVFGVIPALLLAAAGVIQLLQAGGMMWTAVHRLLGVVQLLSAVAVMLLVTGAADPERAGVRRAATVAVVIYGCIWLITAYKDAAADPVIWRFAVEILALCTALIAFYYLAGYQFGCPKPMLTIFFCYFGAFLCVVSAIDEHPLADSISYTATALLLFMQGFVLTENLKKTDRPYKLDEDVIKN